MQQDRKKWEEKTKSGIIGKQDCPFCKKPDKQEEKLILWQNELWEVRYNKFPYGGIKQHLLAFPKRHIEYTKKLNKKEFASLKEVEKFISDFFGKKEYFGFIRESLYGRSIAHLHYHYLPGNIHGTDFAKILKKQGY